MNVKCATCKHWTPCERQRDPFIYGKCWNPKLGEDNGRLVRVYDDSLPIETRDDFGCIAHEERQ